MDLAAARAEHVEQFQAKLLEARQLQADHRYDEAIALLHPLTKAEHPKQMEHTHHAKRLIEQLIAQRDRRRVETEAAYQEARRRFSASDYEAARRILEDVPSALRCEAVEGFLKQVQARQQEVASLRDELKTAIRSRRLLNLLPKIERLLALRPDHTQAKKLARQLQDRLCRAARQRLTQHEYDTALTLLEQIPDSMRTSQSTELRQQAAELAFLACDLRNAPVVDEALLAVAERLRNLAPHDRKAARLFDELRRRAKLVDKDVPQTVVPWASPPERPYVGCEIDWVTGLQRITCADGLDKSSLIQHPGCFWVACGLALQATGKAALRTNLHPQGHGRSLGKIARAIRRPPARAAWGIDMGSSSLKAIKLVFDSEGDHAVIEDAAFIEHGKLLSQAVNQEEKEKLSRETLESFLSQRDLKGDRVCVGLPGRMVLGRELKLPPVRSAKEADLVRYEARHQLPFRLEELVWDYQLLGGTNCGRSESQRQGILVAAKRTQADQHLARFQRSGVHVDLLQSDCLALHNFVAHEYFPEGDKGTGPGADETLAMAAMDLGSDGTNIVVSSPSCLWFRACGLGGYSFTRALIGEFNLTLSQAEQLKRQPAAPHLHKTYLALQPTLEDLVKELQTTLELFSRTHRTQRVHRILGLGGGFQLHGLLRYLRLGR